MIEQRTGEAFEFDEQLTLEGSKLQPGDVLVVDILDMGPFPDPDNEWGYRQGAAAERCQLAGHTGLPRRNPPV